MHYKHDFENAVSQFNKIINGERFCSPECLLSFRRKLFKSDKTAGFECVPNALKWI
jgi:hypothetical protein